jgi:hypothetical protein
MSNLTTTGTTAGPARVREGTRALYKPLTERGLRGRRALKRLLYAQLTLRSAILVALGKEQPLMNFIVKAEPPSVYVVWRVRPEAVERLPDALSLPPDMPPTPIRCLADDEPEYLVTCNYYEVGGIARGLRAEWSVFVADAAGIPRYLVFDARSSELSMDPVDVITPKSTVEHARVGERIVTRIGDDPEALTCLIEMPGGDEAPLVRPHAEWAAANDYIYWCNGICDRTWYDAGMHDPRKRKVPAHCYEIEDHTPWAELLDPDPVHVLVFDHEISLAMAPWENLDRIGPTPDAI